MKVNADKKSRQEIYKTLNITKTTDMDKVPVVNCCCLKNSDWNIKVPFRLDITSFEGIKSEIVCTEVIRILPAKRLVCYGIWQKKNVVAKIFLNSCKAKKNSCREAKGINELADAGIKTPAIFFKGNLEKKTYILIFEKIEHASGLGTIIKKTKNAASIIFFLNKAVSVIADQHNAGLKQDDIHPDNFLVTENDIYTIDGSTIDTKNRQTALSVSKSINNLGLFFAQFNLQNFETIDEIFRFYLKKRNWPFQKILLNKLINEIKKQQHIRKKKFVKKSFRECTSLVCRKNMHFFMVCDRNNYDKEMICFLDNPDMLIDQSIILKKGNSSTVALVNIGKRKLVVKRYNMKNMWHAIKRLPRKSRAWISWQNAHLLSFWKILTPKPVAFMEKRFGPFRSTAYFISEYVEGKDACTILHSDKLKNAVANNIADQFAKLFQSLSNVSISHGDFKATNFISNSKGLFVIDLDNMHEHLFKWSLKKALKRDKDRFMKN